jgi:predicted ribosome quality control (RQC) complex YloA/Tae2 family protein
MVDELIEDYYGKRFGKAFQPYETSYGLKLNTIEEAIRFNNVHEAMHLGYMMSQRRSL